MSESHDSPPLLRPIPRRPFEHHEPIPPEQDSWSRHADRQPTASFLSPRDRRFDLNDTPADSTSVSRAQSFVNLTSSTLFGIYSPTTGSGRRENVFPDNDDTGTPWGTGAETPVKGFGEDDTQHEGSGSPRHMLRRRSSVHPPPPRLLPLSKPAVAVYVGLRALLLFGLGILYGTLVARFHDGQDFTSLHVRDITWPASYDWRYMTFWGLTGVVLGGLLPWFDGIWETIFGRGNPGEPVNAHSPGVDMKDAETGTDWALVGRGIGAFVGIVYALRKLQWASTLQVSMTLCLVNPVLWYIIDRSKPGFLLSAAVGLAGSAILMGVEPDMVPAPAGQISSSAHLASNSTATDNLNHATIMLGGLASQETIETGIWMLSVLFCCCMCFGNIGRRLAINRIASAKGRWAERK